MYLFLIMFFLLGFLVLEVYFRKHPSKKTKKLMLYPSARLKSSGSIILDFFKSLFKFLLEVLRLFSHLVQDFLWILLWPVSLWYGSRVLNKNTYKVE